MIGERFDRLTVLAEAGRNKHGARLWLCQCDCGNERTVPSQDLRNGHTKSCGCLKLEKIRGNRYAVKHDGCKHPLFSIWFNMMSRCYRANVKAYPDYGGRGIKVCERWHDPWKFFEDMKERPEGKLTIERRDNDGDYEPSNCYWATRQDQARNRRSNVWIEFDGKKRTLSEWAQETGISEGAIRDRMRRGWSVEKTLTTPIDETRRRCGKTAHEK